MSSSASHSAPAGASKKQLAALALGALGVVYGDIGTSPLYTLNEVFFSGGEHAIKLTRDNVYGILSMVFWSLTLVVALKYAIFILRADNQGEGGTMSLLSLALRVTSDERMRSTLTLLGLFGVALFFADSMITPAMSVVSAVEGLKLISPQLEPLQLPLAVAVIFALFYFQRFGTAQVGKFFGPIMAVWFTTLALLGLFHIAKHPEILTALSPHYALQFFAVHKGLSFVVLGSVVLCITGAEALYADMGHFGKKPIQVAWFGFVMPALVINYFGQGALVLSSLEKGQALTHTFYQQVDGELARSALVVLAMLATVIASQAVISGAYSLARQAVQLGYCPRLLVVHTSHRASGQIYIPGVNWALCVMVLLLVLTFQTSTRLGHAYGLAVTGAMLIDTVLVFAVARGHWKWSTPLASLFLIVFLIVDGSFFGANLPKIPSGGWFPLLMGVALFTLMLTWNRGRALLAGIRKAEALPLEPMVAALTSDSSTRRVPGTAIYMTSTTDDMPQAMLHNLKHNKVLHERNVLLKVSFEDVPLVPREGRIIVENLQHGFFKVIVRYGYMNTPNIPKALQACEKSGLYFDMMDTSFFMSRETLIPSKSQSLAVWRQRLFLFMARNSLSATAFFQIPTNRVLELGAQIKV